tara:strand:+ start:5556 stop:5975 length:420 start_codon:yes stop_codon:yes gene_type:complete
MGKNTSFNDKMMLVIGVPIVLSWVALASLIIWSGLGDEKVIDDIDGYATLLAIIGGPALLIVTSMLELWKSEQQGEINLHPELVMQNQQIANLRAEHDRLMATRELEHRNLMDSEERRVNLGIMADLDSEKILPITEDE